MWTMMFISCMLIPAIFAVIGLFFSKRAPKNLNMLFGDRTDRSMKNRDTWEFAHKYFGRIVGICGAIMLPVAFLVMLLCIGKSEDAVTIVGAVTMTVELIVLVICIILTERALKREFDDNGNRIN